MKQLKPQDAQFLYMEDGNLASHITSVQICDQSEAPDGIVRFKEILATVEKRLGASSLYSQKLMRLPFDFDFPYWVEDPHFELEYHVRHNRLPSPSDWRQFCIHVARFHSRPLDMKRPLWEINVIEGLDNIEGVAKGSFALVVKMHHAAVDGTSAQEFLLSMMTAEPGGPSLIPPKTGRKAMRTANGSVAQVLARAAINNATAPSKMANAALKLTPSIAKATLRRAVSKSEEKNSVPMTRFNGETSPNTAFDAVTFDLGEFRAVSKAFHGAKINDVVLAVCSGAMREYLQSKNELPQEPLVITAPINKRKDGGAAEDQDGNNISAMTVPLFTNIANPADRLKAIIHASQDAKSANSGLSSRIFTDLSKQAPAMTMATLSPLLIRSGMLGERMSNAIISNVPGVQFPVYFCGAKVTHAYGMAPIGAGLGLFIATPSYDGKISFSITTTRQIMPDTPFFIDCLRRSLDELKEAAERSAFRVAERADKPKPKRKRKTYHRTRSFAEMKKEKEESAAKKAKPKSKTKSQGSKPSKKKKKPAPAKPTNGSSAPADGEPLPEG